MKTLAAAAIAGVALAGLSSSASGTAAGAESYWLVLGSNRGGTNRGYSIRADGSRLTPLLTPRSTLAPVAVSGDGSTVAYVSARYDRPSGIYLSRADGSGLRRVAAAPASNPALSRDGRLLAFTASKPGIWIAGADGRGARRLTDRHDESPSWSPDGSAVVLFRMIGDFAGAVVVQPLHGTRRVLAWSFFADPSWSPDGRWIGYKNEDELWLVRPNGSQRHRIARQAGAFAWAPEGRRLAFATGGDVAVVGVNGRERRLHPSDVYVTALRWSPDGRRFALTGDGAQIWVLGVDGRGLRRVTREGSNDLVGWTRLAPIRAPARPIPRTEHVVSRNTLTTRAPIFFDIAADGLRVAFGDGTTTTDCRHVAVWTPAERSVVRLPDVPAPCGEISLRDSLYGLTLAGTRAAWLQEAGGNTLEQYIVTATLARPATVELARGEIVDEVYGTSITGLAGDGPLLVFGLERRCSRFREDDDACPPGRKDRDVVAATVYRAGGPGPCPFDRRAPHACTAVAKADGPLTVLAVDAGRIVVATATGVRLLTSTGGVIRDFPASAREAMLSSNRLAVRTESAVEIYDVDSGRLLVRIPAAAGLRLEDLEGDVLVTASGSTVTLRRLGDGRTATFEAVGRARAQLEAPGLFVAGTRRLTFTAMADVLRRLGG